MRNRLLGALTVLSLVLLSVFWSGCEDDSLGGAVFYVAPNLVTLAESGETVIFEAVGGSEPLAWKVTDDTMGTLTGDGRTVTYTRSDKPGANSIRVEDDNHWTASATVIQDNPLGGLALSPLQDTLNNDGDKAVFTATGGTKPYIWSVGTSGGKVEPSGPNQAIYTRMHEGNNTVIVSDQSGFVAIADVTQPATPTLTVSPGTVTVATANGSQIFTASGGSGGYTWSVLPPQSGYVSNPTGSSTVYTSTGANSDILSLSDGATTIFATINKN